MRAAQRPGGGPGGHGTQNDQDDSDQLEDHDDFTGNSSSEVQPAWLQVSSST